MKCSIKTTKAEKSVQDESKIPTQGLNPALLHYSPILYHLIHLGSPRILEWVVYPFSSRSSWPRNRTGVSCLAGGFNPKKSVIIRLSCEQERNVHGPKNSTVISPKKTYRWLTNTCKDDQHHSLSEKCKSKRQWGTISCRSEWLLSKSLQTINVGEGAEKREPSYTVGGSAN